MTIPTATHKIFFDKSDTIDNTHGYPQNLLSVKKTTMLLFLPTFLKNLPKK